MPFVRTGNLLYLAGTISSFNGEMTHVGQVGKEQTVQAGYESAKICALNTLANIKAATGSLDNVKQFVLVNGFVNAIAGFTDSPAVINGASELFGKVFGEAGKHARAATAAAGLQLGILLERTGRPREARDQYRAALDQLTGNSPETDRQRAELYEHIGDAERIDVTFAADPDSGSYQQLETPSIGDRITTIELRGTGQTQH